MRTLCEVCGGRMWDDFTQEEIHEISQRSEHKIDGVDENVSLTAKSKKKGSFRRDLSKVRCYCCNQLGHLASLFPERNKNKKPKGPKTTITTAMEDFASKYDKEISLVTLVSSVGNGGFGGHISSGLWIVEPLAT
jgi:hypothetical protein